MPGLVIDIAYKLAEDCDANTLAALQHAGVASQASLLASILPPSCGHPIHQASGGGMTQRSALPAAGHNSVSVQQRAELALMASAFDALPSCITVMEVDSR